MARRDYKIVSGVQELLTDPDIDDEVRELLIQLTQAGLRTTSSCAGHGESVPAYVTFAERLTPQEMERATQIAWQLGHRHPYFTVSKDKGRLHTTMSFGYAVSVAHSRTTDERTFPVALHRTETEKRKLAEELEQKWEESGLPKERIQEIREHAKHTYNLEGYL